VTALALIADRLIDGTGRDPLEAVAVVCEEGRVTAAGSRRDVRIPDGAQVIEGDDLTLMPGLMDMHVHLAVSDSALNFTRLLMTPRSLNLLFAVPHCEATLRAGVTTVRDAGITPASVRVAVERGLFPGPRMQMAVSILSQTGGHGDTMMPCGSDVPLDCGIDVPNGVTDGVEGMHRKVREVLRAGADWIKLCTSGGVLSPSDLPNAPQFSTDEIGVAVREAAAHGKRCMAHAMSAEGIKNAVRAGVSSIEHGCLLDEEGIELMRRHDAWLVPTLVAPGDVIATVERNPGALPQGIVDKARGLMDEHRRTFRAAVDAGVRIAMGTDSAVGPHGGNLRELPLMVANGMTPMQAICASTLRCAELLGVSEMLGTLQAGKVADVVAVRGDPLHDVALFNDPERVQLVIKDGVVVRNDVVLQPALR